MGVNGMMLGKIIFDWIPKTGVKFRKNQVSNGKNFDVRNNFTQDEWRIDHICSTDTTATSTHESRASEVTVHDKC